MKKYVLPLLIVGLLAGSDVGFLYVGRFLLIGPPDTCAATSTSLFTINDEGRLQLHSKMCDNVQVTFFDHQATIVNRTLVSGGWKPDCEFACHGIHYVYDTHNKITNNGVGFLQDQTLG